MSKALVIASQKGGVGKTTSTLNLAGALSRLGKKVLLIDLDPQCGLVFGIGLKKDGILSGVYDIFSENSSAEEVIHLTSYNNLDLIPFGAFKNTNQRDAYSPPDNERENFIDEIRKISQSYDYSIMDCPPGSGPLTRIALEASESLIIPLQSEPLALKTLPQLLNLIQITREVNPNLQLEGILITQYERSSPISKEVLQQVVNHFPSNTVMEIIVPFDNSFSSSFKSGRPLTLEDFYTPGAAAYKMLAEEIINNRIRKN